MFHFKNFISTLLFFLFLFFASLSNAKEIIKIKIKINEKEAYFLAEVAKTKKQREIGLMFRKSLAKNKAMIFIFPSEKKINMWMKNTLIPLDLIFISKNKKIVDIIYNTKVMNEKILSSFVKAKYVLEINSGLVKELKIKIGNDIYFEENN